MWAYAVRENETVLSPLREGIDRLLPGDVVVDEAGETLPMRSRDFLAAYPLQEWTRMTADEANELVSPAPCGWEAWMILAREHTLRIKPASNGLYTDLFHVERNGQLVYEQEEPGSEPKPKVFRQAEIDAELNEGHYVEVKG